MPVTATRDAIKTRQLLLEAARRRFAYDGYGATTVRDIATDAGVNVALINRYFESKEGLFEACLTRAVEDLDEPASRAGDGAGLSFDEAVADLVARVVDRPGGDQPLELLLLLRSSGDERADVVRRRTLRKYSEQLARIAGWAPGGSDDLVLRAQLVLSTIFGVVIVRASTGLDLQPLAGAGSDRLSGPLRDVVATLLRPRP
ncbi:TetR/AcrR family transcriptional regulator [Frondihabitans australicus]|uniref:TetR family transcriptional regulator n=1 Tax=Frondihabitans australicus TaxID=386892 RepID=A0A495ICV3_9MICO|nr:TetR/AcrR family transcriptional regulator [Frondihabitans australicus]RKR73460.1 TetR family transcriptional regulator [Frondihabitans australicus]